MIQNLLIRPATPDDAVELLAHVRALAEEPDCDVPLAPGEFALTVEEERKILADAAASDNAVFLVAVIEGRIVGVCNCKGGKRIAMRHAASLGISVERQYRNRGIGTALMQTAVDWARSSGIIRRIELYVYERNKAARHVYEKMGFTIEGRRSRPIFQNNQYLDDLLMALLL